MFDQSRFDASVFGSAEDEQRIHSTFAALFPAKTWERADRNSRRDAMHIATAARYGGHAFVTHDKPLLRRDQQIAGLLSIRIWTPEQALVETRDRVGRLRVLHEREPHRGPLPQWPG